MPFFDGHWIYLLIILGIVLVFKGPGKLPEVGAGIGRAFREFKRASSTDDTTAPVIAVVPDAHDTSESVSDGVSR